MSTHPVAGSTPTMRPALRWALLASACAAAVVAVLPEDRAASDAVVAMPARARPGAKPVVAAAAVVAPARAASPGAPGTTGPARPEAGTGGQPWPPLSRAAQAAWVPAAAPPRAAVPASAVLVAAPAPPPSFSYEWIGQLDEAGRLRVFLVDAQRVWAVAPGETIAPGWRVEGVNASGLQLTWLPTGAAVQVAARP